MALAVEFDSCIERPQQSSGFQRRNWTPREPRTAAPLAAASQSDSKPSARPGQLKGPDYSRLPIIRLSPAEKAERSKMGLCWYCPEKWVPNHVCSKTFLAYMGAEEESDDEETGQPAVATDAEVITADISHIYVLEGKRRSDAIELQGTIGANSVLILVDTGSTHDFLHPCVAEKLALPLSEIKPFRVYVGNGESLLCYHASIQTRLVIQNQVFLVNLHILPVHGPDVILGMAWLKSLRRVTSDYETGTIEFMRDGKPVCLRITPQLPKEVSARSFAALMSIHGEADLFEVMAVPPKSSPDSSSEPHSFLPDLPD